MKLSDIRERARLAESKAYLPDSPFPNWSDSVKCEVDRAALLSKLDVAMKDRRHTDECDSWNLSPASKHLCTCGLDARTKEIEG